MKEVIDAIKTLGIAILILLFLYTAARLITLGVMRGYFQAKERRRQHDENTKTQTEDQEQTRTHKGTAQVAAETKSEEKDDAFRGSGANEKGFAQKIAGRSGT